MAAPTLGHTKAGRQHVTLHPNACITLTFLLSANTYFTHMLPLECPKDTTVVIRPYGKPDGRLRHREGREGRPGRVINSCKNNPGCRVDSVPDIPTAVENSCLYVQTLRYCEDNWREVEILVGQVLDLCLCAWAASPDQDVCVEIAEEQYALEKHEANRPDACTPSE